MGKVVGVFTVCSAGYFLSSRKLQEESCFQHEERGVRDFRKQVGKRKRKAERFEKEGEEKEVGKEILERLERERGRQRDFRKVGKRKREAERF